MFIDVSGQSNGARDGLAVARAAERAAVASSGACYRLSGEQRSVLQWRAAKRATVASGEACLNGPQACYSGARLAMKADFDCGVLLQTSCLMSSVAGCLL